ncbi:cytochrome b5 domain-containing protein 1 [Cephus cinctus]|uniref:Cytochrome b5 domain-containing protein 1 n=1 Tax=Cephus cinctus TaxID=211228 RepID=A0AAJ7RHG6_CEPCN|nr:cytochrome b5 domain-containing protein 1 [Cephus cinctus]XP_024940694.1 cytochrome b5 domain-containing protein 1 [Cephus cinctus]
MAMTENFKCNKCTCQLPYFLPCEVSLHNTTKDCWVSYRGSVYDLTELCNLRKGHQGIELIIAYAGKDISHWSYDNAKEHVAFGESINSTVNNRPSWLDDKYMRGNLTKNARPCRIINVLTGTEAVILICEEDTVARIQERFLGFNAHGTSYTWKFEGLPIDTNCTLTENGIVDERERFLEAGLPDDTYIPAILCYYNDDLTEQ